jgi:hypothetical protein
VDKSSGTADPEAAGADRGTVLLLLVMELVDRGEDPLTLFALDLVGGLDAERVVGVGDVPAEPVVPDRRGGPFPAVTLGPHGRSGSERGVEVVGRGSGEVGGPDAGVVTQLGIELPQLGPGARDLLARRQTHEPLVEPAEPVVEPGEPLVLPVELGSEPGALGAGASADGGADGAGPLTLELLDSSDDRGLLLGGAVMFGQQVGLLLDGLRGEPPQGGPPARGELRDLGGYGLLGSAAAEPAGQVRSVGVVDVVMQPVVADVDGSVVELVGEPAAGRRDVAPLSVQRLGAQRVGVLAESPWALCPVIA